MKKLRLIKPWRLRAIRLTTEFAEIAYSNTPAQHAPCKVMVAINTSVAGPRMADMQPPKAPVCFMPALVLNVRG